MDKMIPKKHFIILIVLSLLVIVTIFWTLRPQLSDKGAVLSQEKIETDIILLTKENLRKVMIRVVNNGDYQEYTVKENGVIDNNSKVIQVIAKSEKSPYPEGLEFKEAVRILYFLNERKPSYKIAGILTDIVPSGGFSYNRVAFISNKEFLEKLNANKDITDVEQLIEIISINFMKKE